MSERRLIFVYAADSGRLNAWFDAAHKLLSPGTYQCGLCAITHTPFAVRSEWRQFVEELAIPCEFLHRDELRSRYPDLQVNLPAVLAESESGLSVCLAADQIDGCQSIADLRELITVHFAD